MGTGYVACRESAMRITLNGKPEVVDDADMVSDLLARLRLEPVRVAVEINEDLVPRRTFGQTPLREGDRVEIVTFVGGG